MGSYLDISLTNMKLVSGFVTAALVGLSHAGPVAQNSEPMEEIPEVFYMKPTQFEISPSQSSGHKSRITMTSEKIPNGGDWNMAYGICRDMDINTEPWCPDSADQAMEVFCNMAAVHLMPNSVATGVLDESEVQNIAGGFWTGASTTFATSIPDTIDHTSLVFGDGSVNDVYTCGDGDGDYYFNFWYRGDYYGDYPGIATPLFTYDTAPGTHGCLTWGDHGGYGDTFEPFSMTNAPCQVDDDSNAKFLLCATSQGMAEQNGEIEMTQANINLVKEAFTILNDPAYAPATTAAPATEAPVTSAPTSDGGETAAPAEGNNNTKIIVIVLLVVVAVVAFTQMKK